MRLQRPDCLAAIFALALIAGPRPAYAQPGGAASGDPNSLAMNVVLTVPLKDYSISGLVTHLPEAKTFKYGIALFPGYPSIMKLREEAGQPRFELRGNFLIRSRRHWLDDETLVISIDAPSDQWTSFSRQFRQDPRYGADVAALLAEASRRYAVSDWTLVGTSEGTISAFHAARMNPGMAQRVILTSSLFLNSGKGRGLSGVSWDGMKARLLWVHHEFDPCEYTPYREARQFAEMTRSPLLTVRGGGPSSGAPCEARSAHGFIGMERETVLAMRSWVKTGVTPVDVGKE
ncbi:MAG: hypothetical protein M0Q22_08200 [Sulfuritalea sp.]|jgi:pimeloyl-ACP methyl ester carboxylesterase|nr:hypothetical protein [Sulfuritalea sp.]